MENCYGFIQLLDVKREQGYIKYLWGKYLDPINGVVSLISNKTLLCSTHQAKLNS